MLNVSCPINDLSLGNVSVNILYELYKKDEKINLFPVGNKLELSAYEWMTQDFANWLVASSEKALKNIKKSDASLKIWHIMGSESMLPNQSLFSFHETSQATEEELNILKLQNKVFFSSNYSCDVFKDATPTFVPLGFDINSSKNLIKKNFNGQNKIKFVLMGKWEKRKNTELIISTWAKKYGGNKDVHLYCLVDNPFFTKDIMDGLKARATNNNSFPNITFLNRIPQNKDVLELIFNMDIDLTGLSSSEGWNLPAFNATALGKWSIVNNYSAHKDWANKSNSILIEPDGIQNCYDGAFFMPNRINNQGQYSLIRQETIEKAMDLAIERFNLCPINSEGLKLQNMTYLETSNRIMENILNA